MKGRGYSYSTLHVILEEGRKERKETNKEEERKEETNEEEREGG